MAAYRLYFFSKGHIARAMEMDCESDEQAMTRAKEEGREHDVELWSGARVVAKLPIQKEAERRRP